MADAIATIIWNFVSAVLGGIISGGVIAYGIGRWRGEIDQRIRAFEAWRNQVDERLDRGSDRMVNIPVLEAKFAEIAQGVNLLREDMRDGFATVQKQLDAHSDEFVRRGECDRQHNRARKAG